MWILSAWVAPLGAEAPREVRRAPRQTPADSLGAPADSLGTPTDSLATPADSLGAPADSLLALPDSIEEFVPRNLRSRPPPAPAGWLTGVWEWDGEALQSARALTLLELLEEIPGVVPLRGGDYGQPASATAFGVGAGRVRLYLDGAEMPPLDGGVVDLSRIGVAGLDRVRVERRPGELRVELFPLAFSDPRPYSFLEVGTGDLNTNLFRGVFAHPDALGGNILVALDRIDTRGPLGREPGTSFGAHLRHSIFWGERLGVAWSFRRMTSRRPEEIWEPPSLERTDWGIRASYDWTEWLNVGAFVHRASLGSDSVDPLGSTTETVVNRDSRGQLGATLAVDWGSWWADAEYRQQQGPGWPSSNQAVRGGGTLLSVGGVGIALERQGWEGDRSAVSVHGRVWTRPFRGFSLLGEVEKGSLGVSFFVPPESPPDSIGDPEEPQEPPPPPPDVSLTERTGVRVGVQYERGAARIGAAILSIEADSLHPLGLPPDREGIPSVGGSRSGFEFSADLPLSRVMRGLSVRGSAQLWDQAEVWRYLPERIYEGRLSFHDLPMESGNLELWVDVGARGRDPMQVPSGGGFELVPFQQSWFARLQIRVSSVRFFLLWDNFTIRKKNQDYPGRIQPQTRAMYGIRWTMWN